MANGTENIMTFEKSVDQLKFIQFLKALRKQHPFNKLAVFLDNLRVHSEKSVVEYCEGAKVKCLLNSPYSPNFNPIEGVIGLAKSKIKRERWNAL